MPEASAHVKSPAHQIFPMGKQHKKIIKRSRRKQYLKRKNEQVKASIVRKDSSTAKSAEAKPAVKKEVAKKAAVKKVAAKKATKKTAVKKVAKKTAAKKAAKKAAPKKDAE